MAAPFSARPLAPSLARKLSASSPFLPTALQTVDILQQDLMGRIVPARISNRTFEHLEIKFLVLELPLPDVRIANQLVAANAARQAALLQYQQWYGQQMGLRRQAAAEAGLPESAMSALPHAPPIGIQTMDIGKAPEHPIMRGATQDYFVIPDLETLLKVHKPTNVYRIYPRKSNKVAAYATMKEVCSMGVAEKASAEASAATLRAYGGGPSSSPIQSFPFTMCDRIDPHLYRFVVKADLTDDSRAWSESTDARTLNFTVTPNTPIGFDGLFLGQHDAGVVLCTPQITEKTIGSAIGMVSYLRHIVFNGRKYNTLNEDLQGNWQDILRRRRLHYYISGDRPPSRDVLGYARHKGVHLFSRFGPYYRYCQ